MIKSFLALFVCFASIALSAAEKPAPDALPKGVSSIPFKVISDRIFAEVMLSGPTMCQALIDSGSETTILNRARVKVEGLKRAGGESLSGQMVGGLDAERIILPSLALGDSVLKDLPIYAIQHGPGQKLEKIDFVLGMDILGKTRFTLDFANNRLLLWPKDSKLSPVSAGVDRVELQLIRPPNSEGIRPFVNATVNDKSKVVFLADSAADMPLFVAFKKPAELGFAVGEKRGMMRINDGQVHELPLFKSTFTKLDFGRAKFEDVDCRVIDASGVVGPALKQDLTLYNVLGAPFLKSFLAVHIDMPARTISLDRVKIEQK